MREKQVAIIDVGSSKITAIAGERGINKTFVIKGRYEFPYEGFSDGAFLDEDELPSILASAVYSLKQNFPGGLGVVYVGVPAEFTEVVVKDSQISFDKKKKIEV